MIAATDIRNWCEQRPSVLFGNLSEGGMVAPASCTQRRHFTYLPQTKDAVQELPIS